MAKLNRYQISLFLLILAYGAFEYYRPKPFDPTITYSNKDKIPFGAKAIYDLLPRLLEGSTVENLRIPVYNHLTENPNLPPSSNYLFVNKEFDLSAEEQVLLLDYVKKGNTVFVSAYYFPDSLLTVLGVKEQQHRPSLSDTAQLVNFVNPRLKTPKGERFAEDDGRDHFVIRDSLQTTVLAINERNEPIYIKTPYGKGNFYLHCLPLAFTNYYLLDSAANRHAFHALSYLPNQTTYWDEYQKQGRFGENETSPLRYIASEPALLMSYYLAVIGLVLYVFFGGKRTQRIIPIIVPPKNTSLEFVKTIGTMYYRKGDHANLAKKLIQQFYHYLRERFGVPTNLPTSKLKELINDKSGRPTDEVEALFTEIAFAESTGVLTSDELKSLNKKIEHFYEKTH
jgi:hypothetical protein